jgi:putative copper export protein
VLDLLSVLLRAASFVLLLQAAGATLFACWQAVALKTSLACVGAQVRTQALAGIVVVLLQGLLEPARMAGELAGIRDPDLLRLAFLSAGGAACLLRVAGLGLIHVGMARVRPARLPALAGVLLALASFLLVGHTTTHPHRWLLASLLLVHLAAISFWLGALGPLRQVLRDETPAAAGRIVDAFSRLAIWAVPALLAAALGMAAGLLPGPAALAQPYGELLLTKLLLFACLLGLAALNKYRLAPRLARAEPGAAAGLARVIRVEQLLIGVVLVVTSVMTSVFSPDG